MQRVGGFGIVQPGMGATALDPQCRSGGDGIGYRDDVAQFAALGVVAAHTNANLSHDR